MQPAPKDCETLYKGLWMPDVPNAAVIGHVYGFVAVPPFAGIQAKYLGRVVSGGETLPSLEEMQVWVADVVDRFKVTQRLTENSYFRELRLAALGADAPASGAGPPADLTQSLDKKPAVVTGDLVATAAGEALTFLDEMRGGAGRGGEISLLTVGLASSAVATAIVDRLRPEERNVVRLENSENVTGSWAAVATSSVDLVLCHDALHDAVRCLVLANSPLLIPVPQPHPGPRKAILLRSSSPILTAGR